MGLTTGLPFSQSDVERLERTWAESHRLRVLRKEQRLLKAELASAKSRLLVPADRWSYEREYVLVQHSRPHANVCLKRYIYIYLSYLKPQYF